MLLNLLTWRRRLLPTLGLALCPVLLAACASSPGPSEKPDAGAKPPIAAEADKTPTAGFDTSKYAIFYSKAWGMSEDGPMIPGLEDQMIPQGLTYWPEKGWLITSNYRETGEPSSLMVIDAQTQSLVKQINLANENGSAYLGHAGGVAVSGKHLWVSSSSKAFWLPLQAVADAEDKATIKFAGSFTTPTRASFTTFAEGILWVGEYHLLPDYKTDSSHRLTSNDRSQYNAWIAGYRLDKEADLLPADKAGGAGHVVPDYILSIPDKIQGMAVTPDALILSQSYGRSKDSALLKYERPDLAGAPHQAVTVGGESVPVWFLDSDNLAKQLGTLPLPPMSEGIITDGGNRLYVLFESGAKKYRSGGASPMDRLRIIRLDEWARAE